MNRRSWARRTAPLLGLLLLVLSCGDDDAESSPGPSSSSAIAAMEFPDVIAATAELGPDGTWTVSATISSPYDSAERYADAFRIFDSQGNELGVRVLLHDHATEQPFTRSLAGLAIDDGVDEITVQGRDLVNGWGGATVVVELGTR